MLIFLKLIELIIKESKSADKQILIGKKPLIKEKTLMAEIITG